ncbi:MAG: 50S ribosomal protein L11 methyltransferase [Rhodospirillales bacterium]
MDARSFLLANTELIPVPFTPEVRLHLATEITPIWQATEDELVQQALQPPFWAFAWPGGLGLARYLLDHPEVVRNKTVLDFASGSGLIGIAACLSGAKRVVAADIDQFALAAIRENAAVNRVDLEATRADFLDRDLSGFDVLLAGDICYEKPLAKRVTDWMQKAATAGITVLMADPGRTYFNEVNMTCLIRYDIPTSLELEDRTTRSVGVWRVGS